MLDPTFLEAVKSLLSPWTGTGLMAPLLYTLARFTRARTVLEALSRRVSRRGARVDVGTEIRQAAEGLRRMGVLPPGRRPEVVEPVLLDPAYVGFDHARDASVRRVRGHLRGKGVFTAGRYGAWDYCGMEASMADRIRAARGAIRKVRGTSA